MKNFIFNHTSLETALEVKDYPYGFRLRTSIFYWIETVAKKGDRFCSCTLNPKNGRMNAPKKSTFSSIGVMYLDENNYVQWTAVSAYTQADKLNQFIDDIGGEGKLNTDQVRQLRELRGERIVERDPFTDLPKKNFAVKWEKGPQSLPGTFSEVRITFDRVDGVKVKEIFEAIKSLNQEKLELVWNGWYSTNYKEQVPGFVRVCVRGGMQLTTVNEETYKEYLASDYVNENA